MVDRHLPGSHHAVDDIERWLERNERFWLPVAVLVLIVMVAIALSSIAHFYASHSLPVASIDW
jgi:hypothetical protein